MAISQSLYTGLTGLTSHQRYLDATGNNLANINTTGYKQNTYTFSSLFSQVLSGSMPSAGDKGTSIGINQGAGVATGSINPKFTSGSLDQTNNTLDVAIAGNGFFLLNTTMGTALTRNGSFYQAESGTAGQNYLLAGEGYYVQGWTAENGEVNPSAASVTNITIPALGSILKGSVTTEVSLAGVLPSSADDSDFDGSATTTLELKGNMDPNGAGTVAATISVPVSITEDGVVAASGTVQEIQVQIAFGDPVEENGSVSYPWTMTTVDWPSAGDPAIQLYPSDATTTASAMVSFYADADVEALRGAGQSTVDTIRPGATSASTVVTREDGTVVEASLNISSAFTLDVSRLTNVEDPPAGSDLEAWYADGAPEGSMSRVVTVYDEVIRFEKVEADDGSFTMQAVSSVEERSNKLTFAKTGSDSTGSDWTWNSSVGGDGGTLRFDAHGDLVSSTGDDGTIAYDFSGLQSMNYSGSVSLTGQDGYEDGALKEISIDQNGRIYGHYSNDVSEVVALIAMANVQNATGLTSSAGTLFFASPASGDIMIGIAGDENGSLYGLDAIGAGSLLSGYLEGSNVDMATEFTNLISAQRGYQFNAKTITTANEMLQTLVQMKQ